MPEDRKDKKEGEAAQTAEKTTSTAFFEARLVLGKWPVSRFTPMCERVIGSYSE
jgi:hypothetical protein